MQLLLPVPVHIVAGGLAIVLGGVALLAAKGLSLRSRGDTQRPLRRNSEQFVDKEL
jgi:hypothetical protein